MHLPAALRAEWCVARARVLRTRLGPWLALLAVSLAALAAHPWGPGPAAAAMHAAMLGGTLAIAFTDASDLDRSALTLSLLHPTTPAALAAGRWLAATALAALTGAVAGTAAALVRHAPQLAGPAAAFAAVAGAAAAAAALVAALEGGNAAVAGLFLYMGLLGWVGPADVAPALPRVMRTGLSALATALPAPWRYERLALGDPHAWAHAAGWIAGGLALARTALARRALR
jgi:hypothetical protein